MTWAPSQPAWLQLEDFQGFKSSLSHNFCSWVVTSWVMATLPEGRCPSIWLESRFWKKCFCISIRVDSVSRVHSQTGSGLSWCSIFRMYHSWALLWRQVPKYLTCHAFHLISIHTWLQPGWAPSSWHKSGASPAFWAPAFKEILRSGTFTILSTITGQTPVCNYKHFFLTQVRCLGTCLPGNSQEWYIQNIEHHDRPDSSLWMDSGLWSPLLWKCKAFLPEARLKSGTWAPAFRLQGNAQEWLYQTPWQASLSTLREVQKHFLHSLTHWFMYIWNYLTE